MPQFVICNCTKCLGIEKQRPSVKKKHKKQNGIVAEKNETKSVTGEASKKQIRSGDTKEETSKKRSRSGDTKEEQPSKRVRRRMCMCFNCRGKQEHDYRTCRVHELTAPLTHFVERRATEEASNEDKEEKTIEDIFDEMMDVWATRIVRRNAKNTPFKTCEEFIRDVNEFFKPMLPEELQDLVPTSMYKVLKSFEVRGFIACVVSKLEHSIAMHTGRYLGCLREPLHVVQGGRR